ncbi:unnamed protein product [Microthlaspi erraticum]|uniref:Uncharacterized protein n=1 Tax=Microthlaspi erraticum TaxID=1685480 RepID=A0A6D2HMR0_9BRAS|nr:unnamed protein product [Microthlaspi erraticum]
MAFSAYGSREGVGPHRRVMPRTKDIGNIVLSNSFGRLGEDLDFQDSRQTNEDNKENRDPHNLDNEVLSGTQGFVGGTSKAEFQRGSIDKKMGRNKALGDTPLD